MGNRSADLNIQGPGTRVANNDRTVKAPVIIGSNDARKGMKRSAFPTSC
jgi:hypothetical protein